MCYSNCMYENWDGECRYSDGRKPRDGHCAMEDYDFQRDEFEMEMSSLPSEVIPHKANYLLGRVSA